MKQVCRLHPRDLISWTRMSYRLDLYPIPIMYGLTGTRMRYLMMTPIIFYRKSWPLYLRVIFIKDMPDNTIPLLHL